MQQPKIVCQKTARNKNIALTQKIKHFDCLTIETHEEMKNVMLTESSFVEVNGKHFKMIISDMIENFMTKQFLKLHYNINSNKNKFKSSLCIALPTKLYHSTKTLIYNFICVSKVITIVVS